MVSVCLLNCIHVVNKIINTIVTNKTTVNLSNAIVFTQQFIHLFVLVNLYSMLCDSICLFGIVQVSDRSLHPRQLMKLKKSGVSIMQRSLSIQVRRDCEAQFLKTSHTFM